jgi:hypothetical protein
MIVKTRIPNEDIKLLNQILLWSEHDREFFLRKINELTLDFNFDELKKSIVENTKINEDEIKSVFSAIVLLYLNFFRSGKKIEIFLSDLIYPQRIKEVEKSSNIEIDLDKFESLLQKILTFEDTIGIIAKSSDLSTSNPNVLFNSQISTDLRYLFYKDLSKTPDYAILKHTLRIDHLDRGVNSIYITLDSDGLQSLKKTIERAIQKEKTLKAMCDQRKICILQEMDFFG